MNVYESMSGLMQLTLEARADVRRTDAVMHEINGKLLTTSQPIAPALRTEWTPVYADWNKFSATCALLGPGEARMTRDELKDARDVADSLKRRALAVYARWRTPVTASVSGDARPTPSKNPQPTDGKLIRGVLIASAVLGGLAGGKVLLDAYRERRERREREARAAAMPVGPVAGAPWPQPFYPAPMPLAPQYPYQAMLTPPQLYPTGYSAPAYFGPRDDED